MHILQNIVEDFVADSQLPLWFVSRDIQGLNAEEIYPDIIINNGDFTLSSADLGVELELFVDSTGEFKAYDKYVRLVQTNHDCDPNSITWDYEVISSTDVTKAISDLLGEVELAILAGLLKLNDSVNKKERELCKN